MFRFLKKEIKESRELNEKLVQMCEKLTNDLEAQQKRVMELEKLCRESALMVEKCRQTLEYMCGYGFGDK